MAAAYTKKPGTNNTQRQHLSLVPLNNPLYLPSTDSLVYNMDKLDKKNIENIAALTPLQEGMLFHYLKNPKNDDYFEQLSLDISGEIDMKSFEKAWNLVLETNEMLRTVFRWEKMKNPVQMALKTHRFKPRYYDLSGAAPGEKRKIIEKIKIKDRKKKFDLKEVPFRITLCKNEAGHHIMIISHHHILYDGWSSGIILKEFFNAYHDLVGNKKPGKLIKNTFKEFVKWLKDQEQKKQEKFWEHYLAGFDTSTGLPVKRARIKETRTPGNLKIRLKKDTIDQLDRFIHSHKVTMSAVLYSTWGILLQKYNNTNDVIFGTTVSGRPHKIKGIEEMVGLFINTVPLRVLSHDRERIVDLLNRINKTLQVREEYERSSLVKIKKYSQLNPKDELFNSIVVIENYPLGITLTCGTGPLTVNSYSSFEMTHYDLTVGIFLSGEIEVNFMYNSELFEEDVIRRISLHFSCVLEDILENPRKTLNQLELLSQEEKKQILVDFNDTKAEYPTGKTIHELFTEQAELTPHHTALVGVEGTRGLAPLQTQISITYRELNKKSNQLAYLLQAKGVKPDTIVGIMVERSLEMVIGIMAILKTNAAYLPIDPHYPRERVDFMLKDSNARIILKKSEIRNPKSETNPNDSNSNDQSKRAEVTVLDFEHLNFEFVSNFDIRISNLSSSSLAYLLYTSGSTGKPKGVMVEHTSVVNILWTLQNQYPFGPSDTYLLKTAYVFDVSAAELFGWFLGGGRLAILEKGGEKDPEKILDTIEPLGVTHINFVPSMFNSFVEGLNPGNIEKLSGLKFIFLAGEALLPELVNKFRRLNTQIVLENIYGPTEGTVYSSRYSLSHWNGRGSIPIGKPIRNTRLYILDKDSHLQPIGVPGELCIAGVGVARGYLNNPELTAERFLNSPRITRISTKKFNKKLLWGGLNQWVSGSVGQLDDSQAQSGNPLTMMPRPHPETNENQHKRFAQHIGSPRRGAPGRRRQKIYKTGDLARWLADGNIEFLGRLDHQVKIRGFRIEPGEIESQLLSHKEIKEAVVIAREDEVGDHFLCAYIIPYSAGSGSLDVPQLREYLQEKFPDYMVPAYFVQLAEIPLTPSGKIDQRALPEPEMNAGENYMAPRSEIEEKLVGIWSQVLGIEKEKIGIRDNFFQLGGHSLKATRLIAQVHKELGVKIEMTEFFKTLTISELSSYVPACTSQQYISIEAAEKKDYYPLSSAQKRLYLLQRMDRDNTGYNIPSVMELKGEVNKDRLEGTFKELIKRHESLRTAFVMLEGEPVQKVHQEVDFEIEYYEAHGAGTGHRAQGEERASIIDNFIHPFDLSQAPLFRVGLIKLSGEAPPLHILILDMHHIITDGTSIRLLINDFTAVFIGGELPGFRLQYKDYSQWQNRFEETGSMKRQESYWLNRFEGEVPVLGLPTDYTRPVMQSFAGNTTAFSPGKKEIQQLKQLALDEGVSFFMVLLAVFNVLLAKVSGQEDIVVGTGIEGRRHHDLRQTVGMFVNTLALRNFPHQNIRFRDFLAILKQGTLEAFENQEYPFEELVGKTVNVKRDSSRNPLFDVMFQLNNLGIRELEVPGLELKPYEFERGISKFDLTLWANEGPEEVLFSFEYCTKLFKPETIHLFTRYFKAIITSVIKDPDSQLWEIMQVSADIKRKQEILLQLNRGIEEEMERVKKKGAILQYRLFENLEKFKNKIAVEYGTAALTYGELDKQSDRIARRIIAKGAQKETFIGVLITHRMALICTAVGILKAGSVFVPLDTTYPKTRLEKMIESTGIKLLLADTFDFGLTPGDIQLIPVNEDKPLPPAPPVNTCYQPGDPIYIYFTSGTTGTPKPILGKNISLMHFIHWEIETFAIDDGFRFSQLTAPGFDAFLRDVFVPLCCGGVICIPGSKELMLSGPHLLEWLERSRVRLISCVPGLFRVFASNSSICLTANRLAELEVILFSGERITASDLESWFETFGNRVRLVNLWGTSETTLAKTFHMIHRDDLGKERIPVGKPLPGAAVMVLGKNMELCDPLVPGELYIRTPFRSFGYHNDSQLNRTRFPRNPFCSDPDDLLHKTGDLGRTLLDGTIDLLGRNDRQVKLRGIRVELEEIENILQKHPQVKEAAVLKKELSHHSELLCAYVVEKGINESLIDIDQLKSYLSGQLPDYMVPAAIVIIEDMPRTPNGKIDFKTLAALELEKEGYAAPRNNVQSKLVELWSDLLKTEKIGIKDNFFALGGNSLKVMTLISRIHRDFAVKIPFAAVFNNPTIGQQAELIGKEEEERYSSVEAVEQKEHYLLSSAQKRLYILQQMDSDSTAYNMLYTVVLEGEPGDKRLGRTFNKLIMRHESLRTSFHMKGNHPVQKVQKNLEFEIEYFDLQSDYKFQITNQDQPAACNANTQPITSLIENFSRPFDLSRAPLLRVGVKKLQQKKYILLLDIHHIITDGISMVIFIQEFMAFYEGKKQPPLKLQYKDYARWQNRLVESGEIKRQEEYWLDVFTGDIPVLKLPLDYSRPVVQSFDGHTISFEIDMKETRALKEMARLEGTTLYMVFLAIYITFLSRLSGQEDIIIGTPVLGRGHADLEQIMGMFVNTLALRNYPAGKQPFLEFLRQVKERSLQAFENQDYPIEDLKAKVFENNVVSRNVLFDVFYQFSNIDDKLTDIPGVNSQGLGIKLKNYNSRTAKFDLYLWGKENENRILFIVEFCTRLFREETVQTFITYFKQIVSVVVRDNRIKLEEISITHDLLSTKSNILKHDQGDFGF
jgi:fengycin family lipopeptide synthetase D